MELNFSIYDIGYFFKKNQKLIFFFLIFFIVGVICGVIIASSSDSYLSLLTSSDKVFFDYVNGKASFSKQTMKLILSSVLFEFIFFGLCMNFFSGLLSFLVIGYQGSIMFMSISAVIAEYGFRGVMMTLFLSLPVNLIMLASNICFATICFSRAYSSYKIKRFSNGFENGNYWFSILAIMLFNIVFSCLINIVFSIVLRSRIFIIF